MFDTIRSWFHEKKLVGIAHLVLNVETKDGSWLPFDYSVFLFQRGPKRSCKITGFSGYKNFIKTEHKAFTSRILPWLEGGPDSLIAKYRIQETKC